MIQDLQAMGLSTASIARLVNAELEGSGQTITGERIRQLGKLEHTFGTTRERAAAITMVWVNSFIK